MNKSYPLTDQKTLKAIRGDFESSFVLILKSGEIDEHATHARGNAFYAKYKHLIDEQCGPQPELETMNPRDVFIVSKLFYNCVCALLAAPKEQRQM